MNRTLLLVAIGFISTYALAQNDLDKYGHSQKNPFGLPNPDAPGQVKDFDELMGISDCKSIRRNPDGTWQDSLQLTWKFKYIMNGNSVQDETWTENGNTATSIRQYNSDSLNWVVTYAGTIVSNTPAFWMGNREGNKIVLNKPQKAPNGMDGTSRLTFFDITEEGFSWKGEWVDLTETVTFPFWQIFCTKRKDK